MIWKEKQGRTMRKIKLEYDRIYPDKKKIACLTCLKLAIFLGGGETWI